MLNNFLEYLDRFELGFNSIDWWWVPRFFNYQMVSWKDGKYADEIGVFWLNIRFSMFYRVMSYTERLARKKEASK